MFLKYGCSRLNNTIYDDIYQVPPGSYLVKKLNKSLKTYYYWKPEDHFTGDFTPHESGELLQSVLSDHINEYIDTSRDLAFLFSGGVDSSAIISVASSLLRSDSNLYGFTLGDKNDNLLKETGNALFPDKYIYDQFNNDEPVLTSSVLDLPFYDTSIYSYLRSFLKSPNLHKCITEMLLMNFLVAIHPLRISANMNYFHHLCGLWCIVSFLINLDFHPISHDLFINYR